MKMSAGPMTSRHCRSCNTFWPAIHEYTACPLCDVPTQSRRDVMPDFETKEQALAHVFAVQESRRKRAEFEKFYAERAVADLEVEMEQWTSIDPAEIRP